MYVICITTRVQEDSNGFPCVPDSSATSHPAWKCPSCPISVCSVLLFCDVLPANTDPIESFMVNHNVHYCGVLLACLRVCV